MSRVEVHAIVEEAKNGSCANVKVMKHNQDAIQSGAHGGINEECFTMNVPNSHSPVDWFECVLVPGILEQVRSERRSNSTRIACQVSSTDSTICLYFDSNFAFETEWDSDDDDISTMHDACCNTGKRDQHRCLHTTNPNSEIPSEVLTTTEQSSLGSINNQEEHITLDNNEQVRDRSMRLEGHLPASFCHEIDDMLLVVDHVPIQGRKTFSRTKLHSCGKTMRALTPFSLGVPSSKTSSHENVAEKAFVQTNVQQLPTSAILWPPSRNSSKDEADS